MVNRLMDRYDGDFKRVCEHYAEVLGDEKLKGERKNNFIEWMYKSKDYSPSNYRKMFANPSLYYRCFCINELLNSGEEQHHIMVVTGKIGKGKTTLAEQCCALVDPSFSMSRVCYLPHQFFNIVRYAKPGQAILIDEGGNFFKALNTMGKMSKNLGQYFQMMRAKRLFIVICYDEFEKMMREIREKTDTILMKVTKKDEPAPSKYRYWVGWNNKGTEKVINFLNAKKLPLTAPPLMAYSGLRGVNSDEFATLNDVSEQAFKDNKLKNVSDFEEQFLKESLKNFGLDEEHYDNEKKNTNLQEIKDKYDRYVTSGYLEKKYKSNQTKLKRYRSLHPDLAIPNGNKYLYHEQKYRFIAGIDKKGTELVGIPSNQGPVPAY